MAHDHHHHTFEKGLQWAFWLNAAFCIVELGGGYVTHSSAITSDAIHDAGDALAIGLSVWLQRVSAKGRDDAYTFGYKRYALLSSVILCTLLIGGALFMIVQGAIRLFNPTEVSSVGMLYLAILGLAVNGFAALQLSRSEKKHAHEHGRSHNTKAVFLHLIEDLLGWAAVLIGAIIIYYTHWYWIDGLLSMAIAVYILSNAVPQLISTARIFLQATPLDVDLHVIEKDLLSVGGVIAVHDLHAWSMNEHYNILTLHVVIAREHTATDIKPLVDARLAQYPLQHITLQIEYDDAHCALEDC